MTCVENYLSQIATFSQFQVYLNVTQAKQMISSLLLNHFYPVISHRHEFKRKRRIIVYGSVARYGPRNQLSEWGVNPLTYWNQLKIDMTKKVTSDLSFELDRDHFHALAFYDAKCHKRTGLKLQKINEKRKKKERSCWNLLKRKQQINNSTVLLSDVIVCQMDWQGMPRCGIVELRKREASAA